MSFFIPKNKIKALAGLELNDLLVSRLIPKKTFDNSRITSNGTTIYDINGEVLFNRIPIRKGRNIIGFLDLAMNSELGKSVLSVSHGYSWDHRRILYEAKKIANKKFKDKKYTQMRFVAYSYPKIGIQFLFKGKEVLFLELFSWEEIPEVSYKNEDEPPSNFERWSFLENISKKKRSYNKKKFRELYDKKGDFLNKLKRKRYNVETIRVRDFWEIIRIEGFRPLFISKELHYGTFATDHHICYELRGQLTNVWCVAASVQMILDFYRYNYSQDRIAQELGLGTRNNPNGLPYSRDHDVVDVLENLSSNALDANMNTSPNWSEFISAINNNRPLISFVPGHSRTVAGYRYGPTYLSGSYKGLLVYDPWPPSTTGDANDGGVITSWENFDAATYRRTFTASLKLV